MKEIVVFNEFQFGHTWYLVELKQVVSYYITCQKNKDLMAHTIPFSTDSNKFSW